MYTMYQKYISIPVNYTHIRKAELLLRMLSAWLLKTPTECINQYNDDTCPNTNIKCE